MGSKMTYSRSSCVIKKSSQRAGNKPGKFLSRKILFTIGKVNVIYLAVFPHGLYGGEVKIGRCKTLTATEVYEINFHKQAAVAPKLYA